MQYKVVPAKRDSGRVYARCPGSRHEAPASKRQRRRWEHSLFQEFSRLLADEGWAMAGAIAGLLLTFGAYFLAVLWTMFRGGDFPEWWGWDEVLTACVFAMVMSNALSFTVGMFVTCLMLHLAKMMPCAAGVAFLTALDALFLMLAVMAVKGKKNAG